MKKYYVVSFLFASILLIVFAPSLGFELPFGAKNEPVAEDGFINAENKLNEKLNSQNLSEKNKPKVVNVIGNGNHSSEKPFVDSDDCYDKYELDLIKDRKLNFVSKGKGNLELYEGKNVRFCYRDLDDKVGGELVIDGVEYSVSGYYSAEGNYESSVWKSEEKFGVMYWNVWHDGDCMSLTIKLNCKESEIEVCKKKKNSNVWGNDNGGNGKGSD